MSDTDKSISHDRLHKRPENRTKHRLGILANTVGIFLEPTQIANPENSFGCGKVSINFGEEEEIAPYQGPHFASPSVAKPHDISHLGPQKNQPIL